MCHQPKCRLSTNHRGFIIASSGQSREVSYSDPSQGLSQGVLSIPPLSEQIPLPWTTELCLQQDWAPSACRTCWLPVQSQGTHWFCAESTQLHWGLLNQAKAEPVTRSRRRSQEHVPSTHLHNPFPSCQEADRLSAHHQGDLPSPAPALGGLCRLLPRWLP